MIASTDGDTAKALRASLDIVLKSLAESKYKPFNIANNDCFEEMKRVAALCDSTNTWCLLFLDFVAMIMSSIHLSLRVFNDRQSTWIVKMVPEVIFSDSFAQVCGEMEKVFADYKTDTKHENLVLHPAMKKLILSTLEAIHDGE